MAIQFQCPYCSATIRVADAAAGKVGQCPKCQAKLQVPEIAPPAAPPVETASARNDLLKTQPAGGLLGDKSTVFVLPPAESPEPVIGPPPELPIPAGAGSSPPIANPAQAREEYSEGQSWLTKPYVRGAGWPAADRAVRHFERAAELDPRNGDYATQAGLACLRSIERFLESWGTGPLTSIAAFHRNDDLGRQIDQEESLFRPSGLSPENHFLLIERANDGLRWFANALNIDADDAVARCHRAEMLSQIGAFSAALGDAKAVLGSPLVPSKTRDAAQRVADFILGEDSPLRKYLTRSQAQQLSPPGGVKVPERLTQRASSSAATPTTEESAGPFAINTGHSHFDIGRPGSLDPTQAEIPLISAAPSRAAGERSMASRLRTRKSGQWQKAIAPVALGLLLLVLGLGYVYFNRVTFSGPVTGQDLGNHTLQKTLFRNEFGIPDDRADDLLTAFREDPETLRTKLRVLVISGVSSGLNISLRAGEGARLVRVDLRADPHLADFCKEQASRLESPLAPLRASVLKKFAADFEAARSSGMRLGNLADYLDLLGGDLLVNGLGYHVTGRVDQLELPCVFEDQAGSVYFLVPNEITQFEIVERKFEAAESVFKQELRYQVSVVRSESPPPAAEPAAKEDVPPEEPAGDAVPEGSQTGESDADGTTGKGKQMLPPGFYGEDQ